MSTQSVDTRHKDKREPPIPAAQTLLRIVGLNKDFEKTLRGVFEATAETLTTDELVASKKIRQAQTAVQLVALTPDSTGVAQLTWIQRMNEFGAAAIPAMTRRLKSSQSIPDISAQHMVVERLAAALARLGQPGGLAVLECFNNLDSYGQSVACMVLGALGIGSAGEMILRFFQRVKTQPQEDFLIGALWGLIDLRHPQADEALAEILASDQSFAEAYPFASLAGGEACVHPLAFRLPAVLERKESYAGERDDLLMSLAAIGQRLGQQQFTAALRTIIEGEESVAAIAGVALSRTPQEVGAYYEMYYSRPDLAQPAGASAT